MEGHSMKEISFPDIAFAAKGPRFEANDATMIAMIRVALAAAMFTSVYSVDMLSHDQEVAAVSCLIYLTYAVLGLLLPKFFLPAALARGMVWVDVIWLALLVGLTGGASSLFFLAFLFPVLAGSFSRGFEQGALLTIVSAGLLTVAHLLVSAELPRLLMRLAFLLSLGYLSAYWGEAKIQLKRRLELLHDVSQISNPRFGVERTMQSILWRICQFYGARRCVLLLDHPDGTTAIVRKVSRKKLASNFKTVQRDAIAPLLELHSGSLARYAPNSIFPWRCAGEKLDLKTWRWGTAELIDHTRIAAMLDAKNFIGLPVKFQEQNGRLFLIDVPDSVKRDDAEFLSQIVNQAFPVVETIELLDQLASQAACEERKRVALDLHDSAIQPYIGIRLGLNALRRKAERENPLTPDIDSLIGVTDDVITELRHFASTVTEYRPPSPPLLLESLQLKIEQLKRLYRLEVRLDVRDVVLSDRMTGQVTHIVQEGLNNICRHTLAQRGEVSIEPIGDVLKIMIINDAVDDPPGAFTPRSISQRVQALGGSVTVGSDDKCRTIVSIKIPF